MTNQSIDYSLEKLIAGHEHQVAIKRTERSPLPTLTNDKPQLSIAGLQPLNTRSFDR